VAHSAVKFQIFWNYLQ